MKKIFNYIAVAALAVGSTSCNESLLDTENLYQVSIENYYSTPTQIDEAIAGIYNAMYVSDKLNDENIIANLLSDEALGGGDSSGDFVVRNVDGFMDPTDDTHRLLWTRTYDGIIRANTVIEKLAEKDFSSFFFTEQEAIDFKNEALGEAHFMRAFYYLKGVKFFGGMPLIIAIDDPKDAPRSTITETYAQIATDLKAAIELMPAKNQLSIPTERYGHANKWVAQAYMARAYLYYTGYMTNIEGQATTTLPLTDGGSLSATDVAGYLTDCINNSGYALASDFRNLWPYSYVNEAAGSVVLPWADAEGLSWVGQDGHSPTYGTGNNETMFALRYSITSWEQGQFFSNVAALHFGIRENTYMQPFGQGWGVGPVSSNLWNSWDDADPRKVGTILELGQADQGTAAYTHYDQGDQQTGLFNKKYTTVVIPGADGLKGLFYYLYDMNDGDPLQKWNAQDFIMMRFADVLLMHSEITGTADGLNAVRNRAGLPSVGYSLAALKAERSHELALEALRWFDLVRWGDVETAFNGSFEISNYGVAENYSVNYRPETKGLISIPESEIRLSNGVYTQNPGW